MQERREAKSAVIHQWKACLICDKPEAFKVKAIVTIKLRLILSHL